ncbi:hypothetical protein KIN20_013000 [Parelaphostrongylus tenuis]|uniref:Uncharacterized protein n=1 Tax=Parelaphostrongylus tenuis TaxID=148309 RepID=A0AAD5MU45_PARTN|nr:hypothetical protein KIN20_013000 [Parelaphostrongylus tenuis]
MNSNLTDSIGATMTHMRLIIFSAQEQAHVLLYFHAGPPLSCGGFVRDRGRFTLS